MNDLVAADRAADWRRLKALVLDSVSSPITKRVYNLGLDEFFAWYSQEPRAGLTKATVSAWRVALEARGLGSVSINVRITAVRKLAVEAADNGLLAPELAAGIARVKGAKSKGVRVGNWLSIRQAQALLNAPDVTTKKGLRDRAMLAVLLGCGLRRSEVAALTLKHIQQRDNRWCIIDLVGKHGRVRTIPMPTWVKSAIDAWTEAVGLIEGYVLRPVSRGDEIRGERLTEKVIWQLLRPYAVAAGVPGIAPHEANLFIFLQIMATSCRRLEGSQNPCRHSGSGRAYGTWKDTLLESVPSGVTTLTSPVVAPEGRRVKIFMLRVDRT
jgi:site-specific recombinase XerD